MPATPGRSWGGRRPGRPGRADARWGGHPASAASRVSTGARSGRRVASRRRERDPEGDDRAIADLGDRPRDRPSPDPSIGIQRSLYGVRVPVDVRPGCRTIARIPQASRGRTIAGDIRPGQGGDGDDRDGRVRAGHSGPRRPRPSRPARSRWDPPAVGRFGRRRPTASRRPSPGPPPTTTTPTISGSNRRSAAVGWRRARIRRAGADPVVTASSCHGSRSATHRPRPSIVHLRHTPQPPDGWPGLVNRRAGSPGRRHRSSPGGAGASVRRRAPDRGRGSWSGPSAPIRRA